MSDINSIPKDKCANILLVGKTGAGKSTFINYLIGRDECVTGVGKPVTQCFSMHECNTVNGFTLRVIDSKGLEIRDYKTIEQEIHSFLDEGNNKSFSEQAHTVFYCVNLLFGRFENEEANFINGISQKISQPVHIVITNCSRTPDGIKQCEEMKRKILEKLNNSNKVKIYYVNSKAEKTRIRNYEPFGREEVLDQMFVLLWLSIAEKVAVRYAHDFREECNKFIDDFEAKLMYAAKKIGVFSIISDGEESFENFEKELDKSLEELEKIKDRLNELYRERVKPLTMFCNDYGKSMGHDIELMDPFDFIDLDGMDFDIDSIFENSKLGKKFEEMEEFDDCDDSFKGILKMLFFGGGMLLNLKGYFKEFFEVLCSELRCRIPEESEVQKAVLEAFRKAMS